MDSGRWYKVTATRNNRVGSVSVEDCAESGEHCKTCRIDAPDDGKGCFAKAVGTAGTLVFAGNPMLFGGLSDGDAINNHVYRTNQVYQVWSLTQFYSVDFFKIKDRW